MPSPPPFLFSHFVLYVFTIFCRTRSLDIHLTFLPFLFAPPLPPFLSLPYPLSLTQFGPKGSKGSFQMNMKTRMISKSLSFRPFPFPLPLTERQDIKREHDSRTAVVSRCSS